MLGFGVFGDTEARAFHLSFALFLAFTAYPAFATSSRRHVPLYDWLLAALAIAAVLYLVVFYKEIALRPGLPTRWDIAAAIIGIVLLLEASRRAEGPWMPIIAIVALALCVPRALSARPDGAQRLVNLARRLAFLAHLRGRVRRRARRLDQLHLPVRAVRRAAGKGRRRQLLHPGRVFAARPIPRRSGESRRRFLRHDRHDLRLLGRQRRDHRHLHDPADEARRLPGGEGRRDRMRGRRQRPADAARDGRRGVPDGRVCRHHLCGGLQARVPAGAADLRRAVLRGRSRGREGRHVGHPAHEAPHAEGRRYQGGVHDLLARDPELPDLFGLGWTKSAFGEAASRIAVAVVVVAYVLLVRERAKHPDLALDDPTKAFVAVPDFYETARTGLHYICRSSC